MSSKVNRGRTLARSQALQILFQAEALDKPVDAVLAGDYLLSKGPLDDYAIELARGAYEHIDEIDSALVACPRTGILIACPLPTGICCASLSLNSAVPIRAIVWMLLS